MAFYLDFGKVVFVILIFGLACEWVVASAKLRIFHGILSGLRQGCFYGLIVQLGLVLGFVTFAKLRMVHGVSSELRQGCFYSLTFQVGLLVGFYIY